MLPSRRISGELSEMSTQPNSAKRFIAYFSMEIALENAMPSYSGGLGVLAGDTIRAAADLHLPMVAVSLLYRNGYFTQRLANRRAGGLARRRLLDGGSGARQRSH